MSENEKNSFRDHGSSFDNTIPNESVNYVLESIGGESCYMPFNIEYFGEIYGKALVSMMLIHSVNPLNITYFCWIPVRC